VFLFVCQETKEKYYYYYFLLSTAEKRIF